ncbi:zerumbone synthase [Phtheirospermum japonicum]|uniref:Zerumbone synthase n=1 Tax=Phtheirospermum japonicum TaxID=374723 RepID=A0A830DKH1_9LAMI|nr:zerumbone synthase [Phtheirospermum japonicum]
MAQKFALPTFKTTWANACVTTSTNPHNVTFSHCNVTIEDDVKRAVNHAVEKFGSLDIMVNNAGILEPKCVDIRKFELSHFERVFDVNAKGTFLGMKHAARIMDPC